MVVGVWGSSTLWPPSLRGVPVPDGTHVYLRLPGALLLMTPLLALSWMLSRLPDRRLASEYDCMCSIDAAPMVFQYLVPDPARTSRLDPLCCRDSRGRNFLVRREKRQARVLMRRAHPAHALKS